MSRQGARTLRILRSPGRRNTLQLIATWGPLYRKTGGPFAKADEHDKSRCPFRGLADLAGRTQQRTDLHAAYLNVAEEIARPHGVLTPARRPA